MPAPPHADPFYRPPSPLPAGRPGQVLRSRPVAVHGEPTRLLALPVRAVQLLYRSTSARGRPIAVSGTVLVPRGRWRGGGPRPVVGFAPGTHGLADRCAPSYQLRMGTEYETPQIGQALARGWAVAVTDYEGLGTPGEHTYSVGRSAGHAVLDAVRAALRLGVGGVRARSPVALWGYSQGGGAVVWAGERQPAYARGLRLRGLAAGGVPADLAAVGRALDGTLFSGFALAGAAGLDAAYPDVRLDALLTARGRAELRAVRADCLGELVGEHAFLRVADLATVADPLAVPRVAARVAENRAGRRAPRAPVLLYHGQADEIVPLAQARALARAYCAKGARTRWTVVPGGTHVSAAVASAPAAVAHLAGRFAGTRAPSSC